jgi:hypothetical protein
MRLASVLMCVSLLSCGARSPLEAPGPNDFRLNRAGLPLIDGWYVARTYIVHDIENPAGEASYLIRSLPGTVVRILPVDAGRGVYGFSWPMACCHERLPDGSTRPVVTSDHGLPNQLVPLTVDGSGVGVLDRGTWYPGLRERSEGREFNEVVEGRFEFERDTMRGYYVKRFRTTNPQSVANNLHFGTLRYTVEFVRFAPHTP